MAINCKTAGGEIKRRGVGALDKQGKFTVSLGHEMVLDSKLKEDCYAQLHSASAKPCPAAHNSFDSSKVVFRSNEQGKHTFGLAGKLKFSPLTCASAFFWPYFKHPQLPPLPKLPPFPKDHPWIKHFLKPPFYQKPLTPLVPIYVKPLPPLVPVYKKPLPPHVPVYNKPPVYKPPKIKKPCLPPVPLYNPLPKIKKPLLPPVPVYKPLPPIPIYKKPLPPLIPIYKPLPPIPKFPPIYKPPCPPLPKLPSLPKIPPYPPHP